LNEIIIRSRPGRSSKAGIGQVCGWGEAMTDFKKEKQKKEKDSLKKF
jgi:hypothetical protein